MSRNVKRVPEQNMEDECADDESTRSSGWKKVAHEIRQHGQGVLGLVVVLSELDVAVLAEQHDVEEHDNPDVLCTVLCSVGLLYIV